jgi:hypothetical protein
MDGWVGENTMSKIILMQHTNIMMNEFVGLDSHHTRNLRMHDARISTFFKFEI